MKAFITVLLLSCSTMIYFASAQQLEVEGKAKVKDMAKINTADSIVVWQNDGILGFRDVSTITTFQQLATHGDTIFITDGNYIILPGLSKLHFLLDIQGQLDRGKSPLQLYHYGFPLDSLYGKTYAGGLIFYLDTEDTIPNVEGMVAADTNQSNGMKWFSTHGVHTGATGTEVGTGQANTDSIVANQGAGNYAAYFCDTLTLNGYNDWFLPAQDELNLMWLNLADYDGDHHNSGPSDPGNIGSFEADIYWTSTDYQLNSAFIQFFSDGNQTYGNKLSDFDVRAVRTF